MESGDSATDPLAPRACLECAGAKTVTVASLDREYGRPCDTREEPCDRCEGSGVEACTVCGEPSTMRYLAEDYCDACAPSEEQRFEACSLCDGPIDVRESRLPLCPSCESTCRSHAEHDRNARLYPDPDRERVA